MFAKDKAVHFTYGELVLERSTGSSRLDGSSCKEEATVATAHNSSAFLQWLQLVTCSDYA
jgi:hypothetical protein